MRLPNLKKNWDNLPKNTKWEIAMGIWTGIIVVFFIVLLTIEQGML